LSSLTLVGVDFRGRSFRQPAYLNGRSFRRQLSFSGLFSTVCEGFRRGLRSRRGPRFGRLTYSSGMLTAGQVLGEESFWGGFGADWALESGWELDVGEACFRRYPRALVTPRSPPATRGPSLRPPTAWVPGPSKLELAGGSGLPFRCDFPRYGVLTVPEVSSRAARGAVERLPPLGESQREPCGLGGGALWARRWSSVGSEGRLLCVFEWEAIRGYAPPRG